MYLIYVLDFYIINLFNREVCFCLRLLNSVSYC